MSEYVAGMSGYGILMRVYWYRIGFVREQLRMGEEVPVIYYNH